jgi:hypothetical protein
MYPLIRITFAPFLLFFVVNTGFAGQSSVRPVKNVSLISESIKKLDSVLTNEVSLVEIKTASDLTSDEANSSVSKICSCQILNLTSSNFDHRYVVLLAEKKTDRRGTAFTVAKNRIQKEKKHLKQMFYDKVELVSETQSTGSCKDMFYRLKATNVSLQLYEILNADIN